MLSCSYIYVVCIVTSHVLTASADVALAMRQNILLSI